MCGENHVVALIVIFLLHVCFVGLSGAYGVRRSLHRPWPIHVISEESKTSDQNSLALLWDSCLLLASQISSHNHTVSIVVAAAHANTICCFRFRFILTITSPLLQILPLLFLSTITSPGASMHIYLAGCPMSIYHSIQMSSLGPFKYIHITILPHKPT